MILKEAVSAQSVAMHGNTLARGLSGCAAAVVGPPTSEEVSNET